MKKPVFKTARCTPDWPQRSFCWNGDGPLDRPHAGASMAISSVQLVRSIAFVLVTGARKTRHRAEATLRARRVTS
jgi:hypothetical protein